MINLPILRGGDPYTSLDTVVVNHFRTGEPLASVSVANPGLIAKDLLNSHENKKLLDGFSVEELLEICRKAADKFMTADLSVGDRVQSPADYVLQLSGSTGMPERLCRANMEKIRNVLVNMDAVLGGLTRGLDLSILDRGWGAQNDRPLSYFCQTNALGAVLPSNSPGVHSLWLPAVPLKVPLVLKPGSREPWTPFRVAQAFVAAGCPAEAFSFYPADYSGVTEILMRTGRSMFFGDKSTVEAWRGEGRVQVHGPGWSKIVFGEDRADEWPDHLDMVVESVVLNGGRSCINASGVWVSKNGKKLAEELARRLAAVEARSMGDPEAELCAFPDAVVAERINAMVERQLKIPGASDLTEKFRKGGRLVVKEGMTFLLPTVIWCDDPEHPLAQTELLFPFVSVVEVPESELPDRIGPSLVVTAVTNDPSFRNALMASQNVERLNIGSIPTTKISWDQPHEGNLFEHLYRQRAFQISDSSATKEKV